MLTKEKLIESSKDRVVFALENNLPKPLQIHFVRHYLELLEGGSTKTAWRIIKYAIWLRWINFTYFLPTRENKQIKNEIE